MKKGSASNSNPNSKSKPRPPHPPPPPPKQKPKQQKQKHKHKHKKQQKRQLHVLKRQLKWPKKGSLVEVTSDEEGFKGAWYVATLLHFPSSKTSPLSSSHYHNKERKLRHHPYQAYIEYHSLLAEEGSSQPLREYVNVDFIRPLPPRDNFPEPFQLGDVVDAYFRDGWWTGVIAGILHQGTRFVVTFQNPPDELDFGLSELRFHRQWVNCKWVRPDKLEELYYYLARSVWDAYFSLSLPNSRKRTAGLMFSAGKKVEVSFDRKDSLEAWFPATILEDKGDGCYLVEYETPIPGGAAQRVKATVDSSHVRPCPPRLNENVFGLLDKVDALCEFCWWSGVVTKVLADWHYVVFFKPLNKEGRFNHTELRPHMEWKQGNWFNTSQGSLEPSDYQKHEGIVDVNADSTEITVPPSGSGSKENNSKENATLPLNLNEVDPSRCNQESPRVTTSLKNKARDSVSKVMLSSAVNPMSTGTISVDEAKICENDCPPEAKGHNISNQSVGGDPSNSHTWGKRFKRKHKKIHEDDIPGSGRTDGSLKKLQVKSPSNSVGGREGNASRVADEGLQEDCITMPTSLPVVLGLECDKSSNSTAKKPHHSSGEELLRHVVGVQGGLNDNNSPGIKDDDQLDSQDKLKKRRGRPRKIEKKNSVTSPSEDSTKDAIVEELVKDFMTRDNDSLKDVEIKSASIDFPVPSQEFVINGGVKELIVEQKEHENKDNTLSKLRQLSETAVEVSVKQQDRRSSKRGRRRTVNVNIVSQVQDSPHASIGKMAELNSTAKEVEIFSEELPTKAFEDQPLSKWIQEMHSPTINGTSGNGQLQHLEGSTAVDKSKVAGNEVQILPFVKNTLLWSTLESTEIFQKMPQKPHFRPLEQYKESCREGLAIGCMVNFSSVVEKTSKLEFDEPKSSIEDMLETLLELEEHGFNVEVVRERITDLLSKREKQEKLQKELEEVKGEIEKRNVENAKIEEEMDETKKQIMALEEKLAEAMSMKELKNKEIGGLVSKLVGIEEGIKGVEREFQSSASCLGT